VQLSAATGYGFALLLVRTSALFTAAPLLGAKVVPARIRMGMALAVSVAVYLGAGSPPVALPDGLFGLVAGAAAEAAVGLIAGLSARWLLEAALAAGHAAGLGAGLGFSAVVDPFTGAEATAVSQTYFLVAQGSAVALGLHREAVTWLVRATATFPLGGPVDLPALAMRAVGFGVVSIGLSIRLAVPVMAAVMVGHAVMGLMGRMAPQLSLGAIGFSVAILAGGFALYLAAPAAAELAARAALMAFQGG
jgi:flagellar biosynthetic protein FliR